MSDAFLVRGAPFELAWVFRWKGEKRLGYAYAEHYGGREVGKFKNIEGENQAIKQSFVCFFCWNGLGCL